MKKIAPLILCICLALSICSAACAAAFSDDPDAIEAATSSVFLLEVYDANNNCYGTGSGFLMFDSKTLITNYHVIDDGCVKIIAESDDGRQYTVTNALIASKQYDIAILYFDYPINAKPLEYCTDTIKRGSNVVAVGSPKGIKNLVSIGNVSSLYTEDGVDWIQFTAPISPGSSGGVLFNDNGQVIGITSATSAYDDAQNINYAVNIWQVISLYQKWDGVTRYTLKNQEKAMYKASLTKPKTSIKPKATSAPENSGSSKAQYQITFSESEIQLLSKKKKTVQPEITSMNNSKKGKVALSWSSSNEKIAKVNSNGTITAVSSGTATITCSLKNDSTIYAQLVVQVLEPVSQITISSKTSKLLIDAPTSGLNKANFTASVKPANAYYKNVTWSSSDKSIATVDAEGNVTAHKAGTVAIKATSTEPTQNPITASINVTVLKAVNSISDSQNEITLSINDTKRLSPTISPKTATNKKIAWTSSNEKVATISSTGLVTAIDAGTCTITCTASDNGGAKLSYSIHVIKSATKLKANNSVIRLKVGESQVLSSLVTVSANNSSNKRVSWTIKNIKGNIIKGGTKSSFYAYTLNNGIITFNKEGQYSLICTTTDGSNQSVTITVNVGSKDEATLYFKDEAYATWENLSNDKFKIKFQVTNKEYGKTVKAFELYVYAEDTQGNRIYGDTTVYYQTTTRTVSPGKTVYSDDFVIPDRSSIYKVYCGIHKILYADGTTVTIDDIDYWYWTFD